MTMGGKNSKEVSYLNPLVFKPGMPHITDQIIEQLDNKTIKNCKQVSKSWHKNIDNYKLSWTRIVNVPEIMQNGDSYLHLAAQRGQFEMFEKVFNEEEIKDPKNNMGETPFHIACQNDNLKIVELIVQKSVECSVDLNAKDIYGWTPFHMACNEGHSKIIEILLKKSAEYYICLLYTSPRPRD